MSCASSSNSVGCIEVMGAVSNGASAPIKSWHPMLCSQLCRNTCKSGQQDMLAAWKAVCSRLMQTMQHPCQLQLLSHYLMLAQVLMDVDSAMLLALC